jgi:hypothetical protein
VRSHDRVPMGRERNTGRRSDIRAQRAAIDGRPTLNVTSSAMFRRHPRRSSGSSDVGSAASIAPATSKSIASAPLAGVPDRLS